MVAVMRSVNCSYEENASELQKKEKKLGCSRVEAVYSHCRGKVEKVFVQESSYIYEWEKLITIRTFEGVTEEVVVGVSGSVASIEVEPGEEVDINTILCKIEDDLKITGCD